MALTKAKTSNLEDNSITIAKLAVTDGTAGQVLVTDGAGNLSFANGGSGGGGGGSSDFVTLTDTPNTFVGSAGLFLKVNTGETALEFGAGAADFADLTGTIGMGQIVNGSIPAAKLQDTYLTAITGLNISELVNDAGYLTTESDSQTLSLVGEDLSISGGNTLDLTGTITTAMLAPSNVFVDEFTADGSSADFTLSQDPGTKNAIQVFVDGVPQENSNVTLVGTTLTLGGTPTNGQIVEVRGYGLGINVATVADNTITTAKLVDDSVSIDKIITTNTGTNGQYLHIDSSGDMEWATIPPSDLVNDTTPQLGGELDTNGNDITFADGVKAVFGDQPDLQIYHTGTNSIINEVGAGNLVLSTNGTQVRIAHSTNAETMAEFNKNGSVLLKYDGANKLETTTDGVDITGHIHLRDNDTIYFGDGDDAFITYNGTNTSFTTTTDAGELFIGHPRQSRYYVNNTATSMHMLDVGTPHIKFYAGDASNPRLSITSNGLEITTGVNVNVATDQNLKIVSDNSEVTIKSSDDANVANPDLGYHATQHKFYGSSGTGPHFVVSDDGQVLMPSGTTDPTTNLQGGGMYFNSTSKNIRYYNGTTWQDVSVDLTPFTDLLTSSMPHSGINVTEAGIRTETAPFTGATDNNITTGSGAFGWHDGHEGAPNDWPAYIAVYIGGQYPGGKPVNQIQFSVHSNHFGNFELQGSTDANTSGTFYNTGTWTSLTYNATGSSYSNQNGGGGGSGNPDGTVITFNYTNTTPYTHYRIWFKDNSQNGSSGSLGGWASYGWRMNRV